MKNQNLTLCLKVVGMIAFCFLCLSVGDAFAQTFSGMQVFDNIAQQGQNLGKKIVNIAFVASGVLGAIMLIPAGIKFFKGEAQSRDALANVGLGLIAIFAILGIIKAVMSF